MSEVIGVVFAIIAIPGLILLIRWMSKEQSSGWKEVVKAVDQKGKAQAIEREMKTLESILKLTRTHSMEQLRSYLNARMDELVDEIAPIVADLEEEKAKREKN